MRKKRGVKSAAMSLLMVSVCTVCAGSTYSSEFRPYVLPDNDQQRSVEREQQAKPEAGKVVDESEYIDFQRKVAGMSPAQKADLRVHFSKKRDQAQGLQEYKYYSRLIDILDKK